MRDNSQKIQSVVVIGASGFGRESLDILEAMKMSGRAIEILGVVDDDPSSENLQRLINRNVNYLGSLEHWMSVASREIRFVMGIGNPQIKLRLTDKLEARGFRPFTAIHPNASIGSQVVIGEGCVICSGAIISTNVKLSEFVHLNPNSTVGHDSELGRFVSINPGAIISGEVIVHEGVLIGAAALVLQQLTVGANTLIGAAALVTKNVPSDVTVVGIPGRWK